MRTQVNFHVLVADMDLKVVPELEEEIRQALLLAVRTVLEGAGSSGYSVVIRGPEVVSLFH